jgi:hypothetical protein
MPHMPKSLSRITAGLEHAIAEASQRGGLGASPTQKAKAQAGRIMYIECKAGALVGAARIGRVTFSKTGRTLYYRGQAFQSLKGAGFKSNYYCARRAKISGFLAQSEEAAIACMVAAPLSRLMTTYARNIGQISDASRRELMRPWPNMRPIRTPEK